MALHLNIRVVMIFFVFSALLNLTNFMIYSFQAQDPKHYPLKVTASNAERPLTKKATIWGALLTCTGLTSSPQTIGNTTKSGNTVKSTSTTRMTLEDPFPSAEYTESSPAAAVNSSMTSPVEMCPDIPPGLGPVTPGSDIIESISKTTFGEIFNGGYFKTNECRPQQSVAIIIPHRGDKKHLHIFLHYLHSFLIKQQSEYQIFVVENANHSEPLNRGQLFNIGFAEIQKHSKEWQCVILHEPYLIPMDTRNLYRCSWYPRQLIAAVEKHHTVLTAKVGGVIAIRPQIYKKVNGFSNIYQKPGEEYIYFYQRILATNFTVERSDMLIGKYKYIKLISTDDEVTPPPTTTMPATLPNTTDDDGLSTLSYKVNPVEHPKLYTHINIYADPLETTTVGETTPVKHTTRQVGNLKQAVQ